MSESLIFVTLAMAAVGLWRVKFWPKMLIVLTMFILGALLVCFGFAEADRSWEYFFHFMFGKNFLLPVLGLFSISVLVHIVRTEKETLKDSKESKSDAAFPWFLLAIASAFIAFIAMIALSYRFELPWFIWIPAFIIYLAYAATSLYQMNSDKRKQMLRISLSIYVLAVMGLITLILT